MILAFGFVSGADVDKTIIERFNEGEEKVPVIVEYKNHLQPLERKMGMEKGNRFATSVSEIELEGLESDPNVLSIRRNIPLKAFMQDSVDIIGADESWGLSVDGINLTGASQSVCILDTGINNSHPDFGGRILDEKCFCTVSDSGNGGCCPDASIEDDSASDDEGHGTHVAGIVGASGGINGVATRVGLVIVKIMNSTGDGNVFDLEEGIQWCINNADTYNISVITASLGAAEKETVSCDGDVPTTTSIITSAFAQKIMDGVMELLGLPAFPTQLLSGRLIKMM